MIQRAPASAGVILEILPALLIDMLHFRLGFTVGCDFVVRFHAGDAEAVRRINEQTERIGIVQQKVVRAAADDDEGGTS